MLSWDDQYILRENELDKRSVHYHCVQWQNNDKKSENTYTTNFTSSRLLVWCSILWYRTIKIDTDDVWIGVSENL